MRPRSAVAPDGPGRPLRVVHRRARRLGGVLVLAMDTSTPAVTAGVVELTRDALVLQAVRVAHDARKHGELLLPGVLAACGEQAPRCPTSTPSSSASVPVRSPGCAWDGDGPALGDALGIPVHGVASLDAIAAEVTLAAPFVVATDARRREVYWAAYEPGDVAGDAGPTAARPDPRRGRRACSGRGGRRRCLALSLPAVPPASPGPVGLVSCAASALRACREPGPLVPLYLRRPDAAEPGPRKQVLA